MARGASVFGSPPALHLGGRLPENLVFRPANDNGAALETRTVTVRRTLEKSGVEVKIKVPVDEFYGVAVATTIGEDGELTSAIELVHPDENLTYRVYEESGNAGVVAEWQNWGKNLRLPLYIRAGDGQLVAYSQQISGVAVGQHSMRRSLAPEVNRRTRFARRRKTGSDAN